ncbi:MAG TPA: radical SAM protein [Candidatus Nanoarchaeia archaeon]|nr:radical SAM protein [Candidatus Nanoarchaeia archaeon]
MGTKAKKPSNQIQKRLKTITFLANDWRKKLVYHITKKPLPFPLTFQIQTNNICNGSCLMCPISKEKNKKPGRMSDELFEKIVSDIVKNRPTTDETRIWLFLQNEPLTDNSVFDKLKLIKKMSYGKIPTGLVTNGTLLTKKRIEELCESDVDEIFFSIDASTEETYNKIRRGLNYNQVLENIENLLDSNCKARIVVRFLRQKDNDFELNSFREFWAKKGVSVMTDIVNNRGGSLSNFEDIRLTHENSSLRKNVTSILGLMLTGGCWDLATSFNVLYNGDVIICCNDYAKRIILGNVKNNSVKEIWNGKKYQAFRETVFSKDFEKIPECKNCSLIKYS